MKAFNADPSRPEAPAAMVSIARILHDTGDTSKVWFDRAVKAQVDWSPAYTLHLTFLQPQWGGSHAKMVEFAKECVDSKRFDTVIPHRALDVASLFLTKTDGDPALLRSSGIFPIVRAALEGLIANPNQQAKTTYYRSALLICAWAAGEYEYAKAHMPSPKDLKSQGSRDAFTELLADPRLVIDQVALYSSESADDIRAAEKLLDQKQYAEASTRFEQLLQRTTDDAARRALADRSATARLMQQFEKGDWISIPFEPEFPAWRSVKGGWYMDGTSNVRMEHRFAGPMLISEMKIGPRFEAEVQIDMTKVKESKWIDAGFMFWFKRHPDTVSCEHVTVIPFADKVGVGWRSGQSWRRDQVPLPKRGDMVFKLGLTVWDDVIGVTVNGDPVFAGKPKFTVDSGQGQQFGLGGMYDWPSDRVVYRDLRIRKLVDKPASLTGGS